MQLRNRHQRRLYNTGAIAYIEDVSTLVRTVRRVAGLSQRELAERSGVSARTIARIEDAAVDPRWATLARLIEAGGCHVVLHQLEGGDPLVPHPFEDARDDGGRRWPAHLELRILTGFEALTERRISQIRKTPRFQTRRRPRPDNGQP